MRIRLTKHFQKDFKFLSKRAREAILIVLEKLPTVLMNPHKHSGAGIRKLHASGIYEARAGLSLRVVFALKDDELIIHRVGSHDEVRKYLRSL